MLKNIFNRLMNTVVVLIGVSIIAFILVRLTPGNPAELMLPDTATEQQIAEMEIKMGLHQPLVIQYFRYMNNVLHGDLGYSYTFGRDVSELVLNRLPYTLQLTAVSFLMIWAISLPLGMLAGIHKGSIIDTVASGFALMGQSMSSVWFGILLMLVFAVKLKILPTQGAGTWKNVIMPAMCAAFPFTAMSTRMLRSGMQDVLNEDYITATRARGVSTMAVNLKYAFKNALLPLITIAGNQLGSMLAGSMVIENIFGWPGLGALTITSISQRDYQMLQSMMLVSAFITSMCILLVDILYARVDKRITFN